jgi:anti-sigma factor RsiW
MDCHERQRQISMLLDGELSDSRAKDLKDHLASCAECREVLGRMESLSVDLAGIKPALPETALAAKVKQSISERTKPSKGMGFLPGWVQAPLVVMTILVAVSIGHLAGRSLSEIFTTVPAEQDLVLLMQNHSPSFADAVAAFDSKESLR